MKRRTYKKYKDRKWFSINILANFIGEYTIDGTEVNSEYVWEFFHWLDKKARISDEELDKLKNKI